MEKLTNLFFYNLEKAIKTYRQFAQNQLRINGFDITIDQWLILSIIHENPDTPQSEIAEMVFKDGASITRIVELLVQNGFLKRDFHKTNRRMVKLSVTAKGIKAIEAVRPVIRKNRKDALMDITSKEIEMTQLVLKKLINNCLERKKV